jgi:hypothetical protein
MLPWCHEARSLCAQIADKNSDVTKQGLNTSVTIVRTSELKASSE